MTDDKITISKSWLEKQVQTMAGIAMVTGFSLGVVVGLLIYHLIVS